MDIYLVNSGKCDFYEPPSTLRNALYRNNRDGTFTDVTEKAGVGGGGYGMGAAVGDYDGDGFADLYVTQYGRNILYHNNGDGTFTDVTEKAGVAAAGWSSSAVWFDYDNDGRLDLFRENVRAHQCEMEACRKQRWRALFVRAMSRKGAQEYGECNSGFIERNPIHLGQRGPCRTRGRRTRGGAHDKLRFDGDLGYVFGVAFNLVDDRLRRDSSHALKRLPDRGQVGVVEGRGGNVVEAHDRDVLRHAQAGFSEGPNRADCGDVVVGKQCGEGLLTGEQLLGERIAEMRGGNGTLYLDDQLRANADAQLGGGFAYRVPAHGGVRTDRMPFQEGDLLMAKIPKMSEGQAGGHLVVQDNVGHALYVPVPSDGHAV